jgi:hypothetical protein
MTTPIHAYDTVFTDVDLNADAVTTVADPDTDARVPAVYLANGGSTAEIQLEVTDGTDTVVVDDPAAGDPITHETDVLLDEGESLQVNVTTVEGSALSETAAACVARH